MACIQDQNTYTLKNARGQTVLDLSGGDNKSIIGYHNHDGPNQSWIFQRGENGWFIKSAGSGQYLGIEGDIRDIHDGTRVIAVSTPFRWRVEDSDIPGVEGIRILAHDTPFSVDLSDHGNSTEGTKVELWGRWEGANQIWAVINRN
ncbi:carbohydrate-binding module family 13 protein [Rhizopogon salebrosus TDB-379]|nr:carbohydrate-binding module family 13 protein [Rhizopogon salebrosus TDB-379]